MHSSVYTTSTILASVTVTGLGMLRPPYLTHVLAYLATTCSHKCMC